MTVTSNADVVAKRLRKKATLIPRAQVAALHNYGARMKRILKGKAPTAIVRQGLSYRVRAGMNPHLRMLSQHPIGTWVEFGTGIYGPTRRPIRPRKTTYTGPDGKTRRSMLRWTKGGRVIWAKEVRGMRKKPWFFKAFRYQRLWYLKELARLIAKALKEG